MISWQWAVVSFLVGVAVATDVIIEWFYNMTMPQFRRYRRMSLVVRARKMRWKQ
ncbi:hypothetical protein [Rhodococcoides fascians]|uniref:hypothetical protein n=1 Tax=Rhodococcoides fascians TaxID=1828 RepID=UPI000B205D38|nr:hypothetical protein [Rhodococcus fascians]